MLLVLTGIREYLSNSSLHGVRYLVEGRDCFERAHAGGILGIKVCNWATICVPHVYNLLSNLFL